MIINTKRIRFLKQFFLRIFVLMLLAVQPVSITYGDEAKKDLEVPAQKLELARFIPFKGPVTLKNVRDEYDVFFPLSDREVVREGSLHLDFINSNRLIEERSQISVHLNGIAISQITLNPKSTHTIADIKLPLKQLRKGYNHLQFRTSQHYTDDECETFDAPELWTELNTTESYLSLKTEPVTKQFNLSQLDQLINDQVSDYSLKFLSTQDKVSEQELNWGALVSQGVSQRLRHVPLQLSLEQAVLNTKTENITKVSLPFLDQTTLDSDVVLMGVRQDVAEFLGEKIHQKINGPFLGLYPLDTKKGHYLIVVSGSTPEEVTQAAKAFSIVDFPFSDSQETIVSKLDLPAIARYKLPGILQPGLSYDFSGLGYSTKTLSGMSGDVTRLTFKLPPDLYTTEDTMATLHLHLAYGAAFREDSVLNIFLNGYFEQAIKLKGEDGARYRNYQIDIPLRSFEAGENIIEFRSVLPPIVTGECIYVQDENLVITVFDDSSIEIPSVSHYVKLPDLELLGKTGFPFTGAPYGKAMGIQVRDSTPGSIVSAWQLLAKLAQVAEFPLVDAQISFGALDENLHQIHVGQKNAFNQKFFEKALVKMNGSTAYTHTLYNTTESEPLPLWKRFVNNILGDPVFQRESTSSQKKAGVEVSEGLEHQALMMGYQSPYNSEKLMLVVTSGESSSLTSAVATLTTPKLWSQLKGNVILWEDASEALTWRDTGEEFSIGHVNENLKYAHYFSMHPIRWIATLLIMLFILAWVVHLILNRFKRQRHSNVKEIDT